MFRKIEGVGSRKRPVAINIDGDVIVADEGEPLAAVLLRCAPFTTRTTPVSGASRAPFCMMGACFDCLVEVDGKTSIRSCLIPVQDGMVVRRQWRLPGSPAGTRA